MRDFIVVHVHHKSAVVVLVAVRQLPRCATSQTCGTRFSNDARFRVLLVCMVGATHDHGRFIWNACPTCFPRGLDLEQSTTRGETRGAKVILCMLCNKLLGDGDLTRVRRSSKKCSITVIGWKKPATFSRILGSPKYISLLFPDECIFSTDVNGGLQGDKRRLTTITALPSQNCTLTEHLQGQPHETATSILCGEPGWR